MKTLNVETLAKIEGGGWSCFGETMACAYNLQELGGGNGNFANCYAWCAAATPCTFF